jgi:hypothetical protein
MRASFCVMLLAVLPCLITSHASAQTALETFAYITDGASIDQTPKDAQENNGVLSWDGNTAKQIDTCHYEVEDGQWDTWTYDFSGLSLQNIRATRDNVGIWTELGGVKMCLSKAQNGKSDVNNILKVGQCKDFGIRIQNPSRFEAALKHLQTFCKGRAF